MANSYLPNDDAGKMKWLNNMAVKLIGYAEVLLLSKETVQQVAEDAANFSYFIGNLNGFREYQKQVTAFKNILRDGEGGEITIRQPPAPAPPFPLRTAIFGRACRLAAAIKVNPAYNTAIGKDLGIIRETVAVNMLEMAPVLHCEMSAGHPLLRWRKNRMQGIHLYADRGDGRGNTFVTTSTRYEYKDMHPLPPLGQSAVWRYTAIYIDHDEETGRMSAEIKVVVAGIV